MKMNKNTGLVLEGGGMRGVFTSGVLDAFMKYDLYFPYVVAVSAGACNGMSYMSRQPRRARISNIDMPMSKSDVKYGYEGEPIANTLVHENYSHGTDNLIP